MSLFDQIGGSLKDTVNQLLGQNAGNLEKNAVPDLLSQLLGKTDLGSITGLLAKLQESGLGGQVASWLGSGSNLPISPEQIRNALGNPQVQQLANAIGLPTDKILAMLSENLPNAVDRMSPNGTLIEPVRH